MPRGGKRPGAGRKKGMPNKATEKRRDVAEKALAGITPLDVMLKAMLEAYATSGLAAAHVFAKDAAPYVHPRLAAIDAAVTKESAVAAALRKLVEAAVPDKPVE